MQPTQTITIDKAEWESAQNELQRLRQQNLMLKAQLKQLQPPPSLIRNRYSLTQSHFEIPSTETKSQKDTKLNFKSQMKQWSSSINSKFKMKNQLGIPLRKIDQEADDLMFHTSSRSIQIKQPLDTEEQKGEKVFCSEKQVNKNKDKKQQKISKKKISKEFKEMRLVQSICVFGPDDKSLQEQINNRKMYVGNKLLYSSSQDEDSFKVYGEYFYPEGLITVRNIREEEAPTQINQIIFRKNTKKQDCSLLLFRGDDTNEQLKIQNPILEKVNPGRWLSAFFVQFSDFQILNVEEITESLQSKLNKSVDLYLPPNAQKNVMEQEFNGGRESDRIKTQNNFKTHYLKSKYTLCIFTYFPFINVMEQLLSSILDEIKIRRVEKYAENNDMKQVSIKFLINQLKFVGQQINNQIKKIPISFEQHVQICFGNFKIMFGMSENKMDELLFSGWVHDIIKTFDKDVIYDLFTNMMTEQSLCFVCQNMHLLTYVIFFFVCIMPYPFTYPHPCISQVFNFELLQSPFVVTAGINQSTKWLQDCVSNYPKKIFVDLNDQGKIKGKKKPKNIKSQRLKKIFNNLYKKIQTNNSPMPQIFKKKGTIIRPASKQQNDSVLYFIKSLQAYYTQEVFCHLPNPAIITFIKDKTQETNQTSKIFNLLKQIQKYLKQSRKQKQKDQFIDLLIQQQIFYVHMGIKYGLD